MLIPYDSSLPITKLFTQIEEVIVYADTGNAFFTPQQIIKKVYILVLKPVFTAKNTVYGIIMCL